MEPTTSKALGIEIERDEVSGEIKMMNALLQNLAETETTGVDFSADFALYTALGRWGLQVQHSHLFSRTLVPFPGLEREDKLGTNGYPSWRNFLGLSLSPTPNHFGSLALRTVASHEKERKSAGDIGAYGEVDLQYSYSGSWGGVISAGVRNVLGTMPTLDNSNPNQPYIEGSLYDGNGRLGWVQYKQSF